MSTYIQLLINGMGRAFDLRGNSFGRTLIDTKKGGYYISKIESTKTLNEDYKKAKDKLASQATLQSTSQATTI